MEPAAGALQQGATLAGGVPRPALHVGGMSETDAGSGGGDSGGGVGVGGGGGGIVDISGDGDVGVGVGGGGGGRSSERAEGGVDVGGGREGGGVRKSEGGFRPSELEAFERRLKEGGEPEELLAKTARGVCMCVGGWVGGCVPSPCRPLPLYRLFIAPCAHTGIWGSPDLDRLHPLQSSPALLGETSWNL